MSFSLPSLGTVISPVVSVMRVATPVGKAGILNMVFKSISSSCAIHL